MSTPYVGEIRLFPYPRGAPVGWQLCDGSLLSIAEYEVLYTLIGTTYGGNGQTNFAVPDLRGRTPIHQGAGPGLSTYVLGQKAGSEQVTLVATQMPSHFHNVLAFAGAGTAASPAGGLLASVAKEGFYAPYVANIPTQDFPNSTISLQGGGQPHENTAPTLTLNYCIATEGVFPSQS